MDTPYRTIVEHSREAVVILQQCQIKYINRSASTILAFTEQSLTGRDFLSLLHPQCPKAVIQDICNLAENTLPEISKKHSITIVDGNGVEKVLIMRLVSMTWHSEPALLCFLTESLVDFKTGVSSQEREAIFNSLIDRAYNGIVVVQNHKVVYLNEQLVEILGYTASEMIGTEIHQYIHPDEIPLVLDRYTRRMAGENVPQLYESRMVHKNGRFINVQFNADSVFYQGEPADFVFIRDITERKQQQAVLERQNRELNTLFKASSAISSNLSLDKVLETVAVQMIHALGAGGCSISIWHQEEHTVETLVNFSFDPNKEQESVGSTFALNDYPATLAVLETREPCLIHGDDENADAAELALMKKSGIFVLLMLPLIARDRVIGIVELFDEEIQRHFTCTEIQLASSLAAQAAVALENARLYTQAQAEISEKLRAEKRATRYLNQQLIVNQFALSLGQLTTLDDIYKEIFGQVSSVMPVDIFIISYYDADTGLIRAGYVQAHGQVLDVNTLPSLPIAARGKGVQSQVIHTLQPVYIADKSEAIARLQTHHAIYKDGSVAGSVVPASSDDVPHSHLLVPMMLGGKAIGVMQVQYEEKDAYSQADIDLLTGLANMAAIAIQNAHLLERTREQAKQVDQIVNSVPDGVLLLDANKRLIMANPAAQSYLPLLAEIEIGEPLVQLGERPLSELLESAPKGLWHEVVGGNRYFDVVARAIEAGPAPGGWVMVIHDVTQEREANIRLQQQDRLAAVGQLAAGIAHDFNNIMTVISLYTDLVERSETQLSAKTQERLQIISQQSNRAADLIEQILDFSRRSVLERRAMDFLPFLKEVIKLLDRTLIENIHIHLVHEVDDYVINADPTRMQQMIMNLAVNARDAMPLGGELKFSLSSLWVNGEDGAVEADLKPGHWLRLQASDTGTGIEPDVLPHVFDPFYTTKEPGKGSGLGLAQVWGIVTQHEGHITVTTVADQGTTFSIYLPLLVQDAPTLSTDFLPDVTGGSQETLLVVEDNIATREVLVECLWALDYKVITAVNGLNALEIMKTQGDSISLIISDVVMPEMGGISLLKTLREGGWKTAVILLTGHPLNKELDETLTYPDVEWLPKPVTLEQLADAVSQGLELKVSQTRTPPFK